MGLGSEGLLLRSWLSPGDRGHQTVVQFPGGTAGTRCVKAKSFTEMEANVPRAYLGTCHVGEPHFLCYSGVLEGSLTGYFLSLHLVIGPVYSAETWSLHRPEETLSQLF